jgi:hypothetical protein
LAPGGSFADLERRLAALGWVPSADTPASPPIVAGEPEFATWHRGDGAATLHYTYQPAVGMRALEFRGRSGLLHAEAEVALPVLTPESLVEHLRSADTRATLFGLFAAAELEAFLFYEEVERRANDSDGRIASAARHTLRTLRQAMLDRMP